MAISYLQLLILHRRPDEEYDDLKTVVDEHIRPSRRKEIEAMVYSRAHRLLDEGRTEGGAEGIEQGERNGTIESILAFLTSRFQPDAVQALKPTLEGIDDLQQLKELLLATSYAQSIEAFTKILNE